MKEQTNITNNKEVFSSESDERNLDSVQFNLGFLCRKYLIAFNNAISNT